MPLAFGELMCDMWARSRRVQGGRSVGESSLMKNANARSVGKK